jgi:hypothetical protein
VAGAATGTPFFLARLKCHCSTAASALAPSPYPNPFKYLGVGDSAVGAVFNADQDRSFDFGFARAGAYGDSLPGATAGRQAEPRRPARGELGDGQATAVVRALAAEPSCAEVAMVIRKAIPLTANHRLQQVILDTADAQFPAEVTKLALRMVAPGDPVYGASCVGVGKGSMKWSEEELKALEIGVAGGFARGCHAGGVAQFALLSAVGSTAKSGIRYVRVMGLKEETVQRTGFKSRAIFNPGIIAGNAHTPGYAAWLGRLIPGPFGTIEQDDIGRAFAAEFSCSSAPNGVVYLENAAMKRRSRELTFVRLGSH